MKVHSAVSSPAILPALSGDVSISIFTDSQYGLAVRLNLPSRSMDSARASPVRSSQLTRAPSGAATFVRARIRFELFSSCRALLTALIKKHVLPGSGMTLEEADLLLDLYGAARLGWDDPAADKDGYVAFAALKASLVHSAAALSRRVAALRMAGLLETRKLHEIAPATTKVDRKAIVLRITPKGIKKIQPVYERYAGLCDSMLKDVPPDVRRTILQTNDDLMQKARWGV